MTQMDYQGTMRALKGLMVETGSLACLGCGYEYSCSAHGCAILRNAVEHMEAALANYGHLIKLTKEQAEAIKEYELALSQPSNEPLTLEELREMSYTDWVWVVFPELPSEENGWVRASQLYRRYSHEHYGKTWLAYRRPPEGEADGK